ncbi:MAG: hypothetical protein LBI05_00280, partial [Planctomycetaceae bacterium]|nr:hypothetical protein [Planctomycetaceae bacterium]
MNTLGNQFADRPINVEMDRRRALGQFYTPSKIAKIAWNMFVQQLGEKFWQDGTWRIWDNCAGSGNLE